MATQNLSEYSYTPPFESKNYTIGIVTSEWNSDVTKNLLQGCLETLRKMGVLDQNIHSKFVPGSYELPLGAQLILEHIKPDAVICLGSVIQGDTKHFDFVCQAISLGIKDVSLKYNKPVIFGVLTDNTKQQALDRSGGTLGNKGIEAAITAVKMIQLQKTF